MDQEHWKGLVSGRRGGPAAVVARGEGIPAVCGADAIRIDVAARTFSANGTTVAEGEVITIDGGLTAVQIGKM